MIVNYNGKTYKSVDADTVFKKNTEEELDNHFSGKDSVDAKWTKHIQKLNEILKNAPPYKAGRPTKQSQAAEEIGCEPEL